MQVQDNLYPPQLIEKYFQNLDDIERFLHHRLDIKFVFDEIYSDISGNLKIPIYHASSHMFKILDCQFSPGSLLPHSRSDPLKRYYNQKTLSLMCSDKIIDQQLNEWDNYVKRTILQNQTIFKDFRFKKTIDQSKFLNTIRHNYLGPFTQLYGDIIPRDPLKGSGFIIRQQIVPYNEYDMYLPKSIIIDHEYQGFNINDHDKCRGKKNYSIDVSMYPTCININYTSTPEVYVWTEFNLHTLYIK